MGCAQSSIKVLMDGDDGDGGGGGDRDVEKAYAALGGADFQALKDNFDAPHGETCAPPISIHPHPAPTSEEADAAATDAAARLVTGTT